MSPRTTNPKPLISPSKGTPTKAKPDGIRKAGESNGDGTQYGGGPNSFVCSKCTAAGYECDIAHGHRANQHKYCPLLQQKPEQPDPFIRPIIDKIIPEVSSQGKELTSQSKEQTQSIIQGKSADETLDLLTESQISAQAAKLALIKMMKVECWNAPP
jgi:hypothetical protein